LFAYRNYFIFLNMFGILITYKAKTLFFIIMHIICIPIRNDWTKSISNWCRFDIFDIVVISNDVDSMSILLSFLTGVLYIPVIAQSYTKVAATLLQQYCRDFTVTLLQILCYIIYIYIYLYIFIYIYIIYTIYI